MIETIKKAGIIPVIKLEDIDKAEKLAEALKEGGINFAEVTFRAKGAETVIARMLAKYPDMYVGAGTVLTMEEAQKAVNAGAKFIVSPGLDAEIVKFAAANNVTPLPGCVTPTEIQAAMKLGLSVVKFFPAAQYGGAATIKALSGPFSKMKFMPTGGISLDNLEEFLQVKSIIACGGSFMVKENLIKEEKWSEITEISRKAVKLVKRVRSKQEEK